VVATPNSRASIIAIPAVKTAALPTCIALCNIVLAICLFLSLKGRGGYTSALQPPIEHSEI
jgi:hypothetical protein